MLVFITIFGYSQGRLVPFQWTWLSFRFYPMCSHVQIRCTVIRFFHLVNFRAKNFHLKELLCWFLGRSNWFKKLLFTLYNCISEITFRAFPLHENIFTMRQSKLQHCNLTVSAIHIAVFVRIAFVNFPKGHQDFHLLKDVVFCF